MPPKYIWDDSYNFIGMKNGSLGSFVSLVTRDYELVLINLEELQI